MTDIQKAHQLAQLIWRHQEPLAGEVLRLNQKVRDEAEEKELEWVSEELLTVFDEVMG